jgi:hypothetical protein
MSAASRIPMVAYRVITTTFGDETLAMCNERLAALGLVG